MRTSKNYLRHPGIAILMAKIPLQYFLEAEQRGEMHSYEYSWPRAPFPLRPTHDSLLATHVSMMQQAGAGFNTTPFSSPFYVTAWEFDYCDRDTISIRAWTDPSDGDTVRPVADLFLWVIASYDISTPQPSTPPSDIPVQNRWDITIHVPTPDFYDLELEPEYYLRLRQNSAENDFLVSGLYYSDAHPENATLAQLLLSPDADGLGSILRSKMSDISDENIPLLSLSTASSGEQAVLSMIASFGQLGTRLDKGAYDYTVNL